MCRNGLCKVTHGDKYKDFSVIVQAADVQAAVGGESDGGFLSFSQIHMT